MITMDITDIMITMGITVALITITSVVPCNPIPNLADSKPLLKQPKARLKQKMGVPRQSAFETAGIVGRAYA
jgi:hypothetical protein